MLLLVACADQGETQLRATLVDPVQRGVKPLCDVPLASIPMAFFVEWDEDGAALDCLSRLDKPLQAIPFLVRQLAACGCQPLFLLRDWSTARCMKLRDACFACIVRACLNARQSPTRPPVDPSSPTASARPATSVS